VLAATDASFSPTELSAYPSLNTFDQKWRALHFQVDVFYLHTCIVPGLFKLDVHVDTAAAAHHSNSASSQRECCDHIPRGIQLLYALHIILVGFDVVGEHSEV
jgi:hypothetical protein